MNVFHAQTEMLRWLHDLGHGISDAYVEEHFIDDAEFYVLTPNGQTMLDHIDATLIPEHHHKDSDNG